MRTKPTKLKNIAAEKEQQRQLDVSSAMSEPYLQSPDEKTEPNTQIELICYAEIQCNHTHLKFCSPKYKPPQQFA